MAAKETIFDVGESIFTQADSLEDLRDAVRDAVHCHWGDRMAEMPAVIRFSFRM